MSKKSSASAGKPVSPEKQEELDAIFQGLSPRLVPPNELKYLESVVAHINKQMTAWGIPLADPQHETESRCLKFRSPGDLSMPPQSLAEIYVNEILVGFGSENIKEFTVVELLGFQDPDGKLTVLLRGKWESK
jgi:hypothetical protein